MEWVETTGATIDEARLRALDTLGVAFDDAEVEVVAEPKKGLLGFGKADARVRARVRPVQSRAKVERGDRNRRRGNDRGGNRQRNKRGNGKAKGQRDQSGGGQGKGQRDQSGSGDAKGRRQQSGGGKNRSDGDRGRDGGGNKSGGGGSSSNQNRSRGSQSKNRDSKGGGSDQDRGSSSAKHPSSAEAASATNRKQNAMEDTPLIDAAGQALIVEEFMTDLLDAFNATGEIESVEVADETFEVRVHGQDLGLLIGPKGATMHAVQEVARTAVQQRADGSLSGRVHLDIGGYRAKRREALADFATRVADSVKESGESKVLEPMPASDRKVIHDTIAEIEGVVTSSEGEDRRRHIVLSPAD